MQQNTIIDDELSQRRRVSATEKSTDSSAETAPELTLSRAKSPTSPAVQDAAGKVAASSVHLPVNKLPSASDPGGADADGDSVPDAQEEQAVSTTGAVTGDGNADGIQDSAQAAVASMTVATTSGGSTSITLVADSPGGMPIPGNNTRIVSLEKNLICNFSWGPEMEVPIGLMDLVATPETVGGSVNFSLYLDPNMDVNGYWVMDGPGGWVNLASAPYGGQMTSEGERVRLDFSIQDGGQFDDDGVANGSISSFLGAAARMPLSIVGQMAESAPDAAGF
ncbi:hypothetical protein D8B22_16030 [Verminephrobacter aporrectodeae subsp. tuberculatae]|nr:hypothetical protein [Verminephrobacter aporrectodeae subsp. tuberculatae]MCW8170576.1 hypothetical protein [Verminephrobacter aporrectodeae subsp. tuberculatae]